MSCKYCEAGLPLVDAGFVGHVMPEEEFDALFPKGLTSPDGEPMEREHVVMMCDDLVSGADSLGGRLRASTWREIRK